MEKNHTRVEWVDILRFLGILAIYIGHFAESAGNLYLYVFSYHVPLFFFASGFFAVPKNETKIISYVKKNLVSIMLPYLTFCAIALTAWILYVNPPLSEVKRLFLLILPGIRDQLTPAYSLWFLPCLFSMKIVYYVMYRLLKSKVAVLGLCTVMAYFRIHFLPPEPSVFWNIDSMFMYIFFYALGALLFPYLKNIRYSCLGVKGRAAWWTLLAVTVFLSAIIYFRKTEYPYGMIFYSGPLSLSTFTIPLIGITLNVFASFCLVQIEGRGRKLLAYMGENSLMLCGNEQLVKWLIPCLFSCFGLNVAPSNPFSVCLYSFVLLVFATYILAPIEKKVFPFL